MGGGGGGGGVQGGGETQKKLNIIHEPVEQTHYCVKVITDYHLKRALSLCYRKIYIKVYLIH